MSQLNHPAISTAQTHGGVPSFGHLSPVQQLHRTVLSCLLWEKEFYEDGQSIADRIHDACTKCSPKEISDLAIEARSLHNLRHVPLLLLCELAAKRPGNRLVGDTVAQVIQRVDEITELLSIYWRNGKRPIAKQLKMGLARAFHKFDEYQLAKYDREKAIKLRDVLFLCHAKPSSEAQAALWKRLIAGELAVPDTWEVALSAGADKKSTWERLLSEGRLGYFALLRNLRNMDQVGVNQDLIRSAILARKGGAEKILPFRFIAAARACPRFEPELDLSLQASIRAMKPLEGETCILVDVSGSMDHALSAKSDLKRVDAAAALASIIPGTRRVFSFSNHLVECPPRLGMAGVDAILKSQLHGGTALAGAVQAISYQYNSDRLIVITDEQATDSSVPAPKAKAYMINVGSYKNGVGYGKWVHLDGFSESIIKWILAFEAAR